MSQSTICPYCNARLRLSSSSSRRNRVKCRNCDRGFHPSQVIDNDGPSQFLNQPLHVDAPPPDAESRPEAAKKVARERHAEHRTPSETAASNSAPAPIDPQVAGAAFPAEMIERRAKRKEAGESVRERNSQSKHRMKTHEMVLAVALLTAGVSGAAYLGWYLLKPAKTGAVAADPSPALTPPDEVVKTTSLLESDFVAKPLPKRLVGRWELRNDDERRGWFEFRSDSSMTAYAWVGDQQASPSRENWFLNQEHGDDLVIEIGPQIGVIGNFKYYLTLTGSDAFTITQIAEKGVRYRENQRFVRKGSSPPSEP